MKTLSQNTFQNTTLKNKTHRLPSEISRKIVAFEEISNVNQNQSAREINRLLNIPNSTMQTWAKQKAIEASSEDEVRAFYATPSGKASLERIMLAALYNNKCGKTGIPGMQEFLHNSGLDKYVASSAGALQKLWKRCEISILDFGEEWVKKLSLTMQKRTITAILDELFRKGQPCLVAIEAVSGYILLEKFTEDRKAATWKKELEESIKGLPIKIGGVTSDLCGAIRSVTKEFEAAHSPDLFHGQYEISKATSAALSSQERAAEKALQEIEAQIIKSACRVSKKERTGEIEKRKERQEKHSKIKLKHQEAVARRESVQEAKKELGQIYHPINLTTGEIQDPQTIEKGFDEQFALISKGVEEANLGCASKARIEKAKRAFSYMVEYFNVFFLLFTKTLEEMHLSPQEEEFFKTVIFPLCYLRAHWKRFPREQRRKLKPLRDKLEEQLQNHSGSQEFKEALIREGRELVEWFQRSSSCVEGRNGALSLLLHRFHHLNAETMRALTIVANFGVRRTGEDKTTAAERFFGSTHGNLFEHLVKTVKIPGPPQTQARVKSKWTQVA